MIQFDKDTGFIMQIMKIEDAFIGLILFYNKTSLMFHIYIRKYLIYLLKSFQNFSNLSSLDLFAFRDPFRVNQLPLDGYSVTARRTSNRESLQEVRLFSFVCHPCPSENKSTRSLKRDEKSVQISDPRRIRSACSVSKL